VKQPYWNGDACWIWRTGASTLRSSSTRPRSADARGVAVAAGGLDPGRHTGEPRHLPCQSLMRVKFFHGRLSFSHP
jgi:hypothetical protein